jgi:DNA-binding beta-propeller fold protein YncE
MDRLPYDPYGAPGRRLPFILLALVGLIAAATLVAGVVSLSAGKPLIWQGGLNGEETGETGHAEGVSQLNYPAEVLQTLQQPSGDTWLLPSSAVSTEGATFVLDTGNDRLLKIGRDGGVAATIDSASTRGLDLRQPLALSSDGQRLFIANSLASDVVVLDLSGAVEKVIRLEPLAAGELTPRPIGVAVTPDGGLAVSDAANHRVLLLDGEGKLVRAVGAGRRADGDDGFNVPGALAVDAAGNIYVVDTLNGRVVKLSPDGQLLTQFGEPGKTAGTLSRPKGVAVDGQGRVFVSDGLLAAVEVFAPDGTYLGVIGRKTVDDPAQGSIFGAPAGLWLTGDTLYVADRFAGLIVLKLSAAPQ